MRTVTRNAFLSGLCGVAAALGLMTASARADVTTERGASILAFPKVLVDDPRVKIVCKGCSAEEVAEEEGKSESSGRARNSDVWKYNAIGILGTELAGETGNELLLDQPRDTEDVVGQYNACPNKLILNHFAEGVTMFFNIASPLRWLPPIGFSATSTSTHSSSP